MPRPIVHIRENGHVVAELEITQAGVRMHHDMECVYCPLCNWPLTIVEGPVPYHWCDIHEFAFDIDIPYNYLEEIPQ